MNTELSVVIPVYKGHLSIGHLVKSLQQELDSLKYEVILVVDGCPEDSENVCRELARNHENINFITLRKNFGEFNAVICGLNYIRGRYAVIIDDDFQNPPSEIIKLYNKAIEGNHDVVYSYYTQKEHSFVRNMGSVMINYLTTYLLKKDKNLYLSSFKLISREVVQEIVKYKNPYPYIDGMIFQVTNNIGKVLVEHKERLHGESNYSARKLISLFLTILFGYSLIPLRLTLFAGLFSIFFSLGIMALYFLNIIKEWGSPVVIFMCGVLLCSISVMGEYIGKTYMNISGLPQFVIKEKIFHTHADQQ
ncbi:glycosyltransferase [Emticicia sp. CRIBPO]|uniref:glycosyltransferase family 2 protein n=1 Tax=Emticicia sp. CRIBPO TaxID=2683258 RepID=UPI001412AE81|nr:glycosyltransferase family 2 protein [Emticicia sp. CRIBPO]NBA86454.1 glycosyltransferase [Emticicia sp. CRIBPO]